MEIVDIKPVRPIYITSEGKGEGDHLFGLKVNRWYKTPKSRNHRQIHQNGNIVFLHLNL